MWYLQITSTMSLVPQNNQEDFSIVFSNLTYHIPAAIIEKTFGKKDRLIFRQLSGKISSGELVGLLGPGGCGKTSLMDALANRRRQGVTGKIHVYSSRKLRFFFVPQKEMFPVELTVRENLVFASRVANQGDHSERHFPPFDSSISGTTFHEKMANKVIIDFRLTSCADNRSLRCSGGEKKRLSVARQFVSHADVYFIDEPTSGLDSFACEWIMNLFASIVKGNYFGPKKSKPCIILSIHQPNSETVSIFDQVMLMSRRDGMFFYSGPPNGIVPHITDYQLPYDQEFDNPMDILMEGACGCFGQDVLKKVTDTQVSSSKEDAYDTRYSSNLFEMMDNGRHLFIGMIFQLLARIIQINFRDVETIVIAVYGVVIMLSINALIFGNDMDEPGCFPSLQELSELSTTNGDSIFRSLDKDVRRKQREIIESSIRDMLLSLNHYSSVYFPTIITVNRHFGYIRQEVGNGWYTGLEYELALTMFEVIFSIIVNVCLFQTPAHFIMQLTTDDAWRVVCAITLASLIVMIYFALISFICRIFLYHFASGMMITFALPVCVFTCMAGPLIALTETREGYIYAAYFNFIKQYVDIQTTTVYGFDRCERVGQPSYEDRISEVRNFLFKRIATIKDQSQTLWNMTTPSLSRQGNSSRGIPEEIYDYVDSLFDQFSFPFQSIDGKWTTARMGGGVIVDDDIWKGYITMVVIFLGLKLLSYLSMRIMLIYR